MAHRIKPSRKDKVAPVLYWTSAAFAFLGAANALYLYIYKLTSNDKMCLGSGDCATVNDSVYSEVFGIPVALLGLLAYLAILGILLLELRLELAREYGPLAVFGLSLVGVVFSIYLTWISVYVIEAVCPFCTVSAVLIILILVLAIIRLARQTSS